MPTPVNFTAEERAALDAEIAVVNKNSGQNIAGTPDEAASWLHDNAYGISTNYQVELGAGIKAYGDGYGFDTLTTDYSTSTVTIGRTLRSKGYVGRWHTHPASANGFHGWDLNRPMGSAVNGYLSNQQGLYKFNWGNYNMAMGAALGASATKSQISAFRHNVQSNWGRPYVNKI